MNKQLKILGWKLLAVINPHCWIAIGEYDRTLDVWLLQQLASGKRIHVNDHYSAILGGVKLWCANAPYSCGYPYDIDSGGRNFRPSRGAMLWFACRLSKASCPPPDSLDRRALHEAIGKGVRQ